MGPRHTSARISPSMSQQPPRRRDCLPPGPRGFFLIRHGMSENHRGFLGSSDPPLVPEGRRQAEALAETLANAGIEMIVSSRLQRAAETARVLGLRLGIEPATDPRLNEISYGDWDGLTWAEIEQRDPAAAQAKLDDWQGVTPPGGEPFEKFRDRIEAAVRDLLGNANLPTAQLTEPTAFEPQRDPTVGQVSRPAHSSTGGIPPSSYRTIALVAHVGVNAVVLETLRRASEQGTRSNFNWNFVSRFEQNFATYRSVEVP